MTPTKEAREAAAEYFVAAFKHDSAQLEAQFIREGKLDDKALVQAFTRFERPLLERIAELEGAGWKSIETAPKDGNVLVCGFWPNGLDWMNIGTATDGMVYGDWDDDLTPTHWMPLPEPPLTGAGDGGKVGG